MKLKLEPLLTTRDCADVLGVTSEFVRGEILDGRLRAVVSIARQNGRTVYRVSVEDLTCYCRQWCPGAVKRIGIAS